MRGRKPDLAAARPPFVRPAEYWRLNGVFEGRKWDNLRCWERA